MGYPSESTPRGHLMTPAVTSTLPVPLAARVMRRLGVDTVIVLERGRPYGILTEVDLLPAAALPGRAAAEADVADVCCRRLTDVMAPDPLVVHQHATVADVATLMFEAGAGSAVAMGHGGVTGVVTGRDIAAAAAAGTDPSETRVEDVYLEVAPLSVDDDIEQAVSVLAANQGGPVPVVDGGEPVGTVQVAMATTGGRLAVASAPPLPPEDD